MSKWDDISSALAAAEPQGAVVTAREAIIDIDSHLQTLLISTGKNEVNATTEYLIKKQTEISIMLQTLIEALNKEGDDALKDMLVAAKKELDSNHEHSAIQAKINTIHQNIAKMIADRIELLSTSIAKLDRKIEDTKQKINELNEKISTGETKISQISTELERLQSKITKIKEVSILKDDEILKLKENILDIKDKLKTPGISTSEKGGLENNLKSLNTTLDDAVSKRKNISTENSSIRKKTSELKEALVTEKTELSANIDQRTKYSAILQEATQMRAQYLEKIRNLENKTAVVTTPNVSDTKRYKN